MADEAAVQIAREALGHHYDLDAGRVVDALARAYDLCEPGSARVDPARNPPLIDSPSPVPVHGHWSARHAGRAPRAGR